MTDVYSTRNLAQQIDKLQGARVLVIGDIMLDTYLIGDALRISPEAPVPVVKVEETRHMLGGAGNVARNIAALGGHATLVGVLGEDPYGDQVEVMLRDALVEPCMVRSPGRPTTMKTRILARNQQMLRLDQEKAAPVSAYVYAEMMKTLGPLVPQHDVVIVSDYGKGVVTENLLADLRRLALAGDTPSAPFRILVDPKPQHKAFYRGAYLLTPNAKETSEASGMPVATREELLRAGKKLREELGAEHVLTTLGADGMALFSADPSAQPVVHVATTARQVFDVTGAGDTVIATAALALAAGLPLPAACVLANYAAGIVVGKVGASTASLEELQAVMTEFPPEIALWND